MEVYSPVFINFKQNNLARLFTMANFPYHNVKNASTSHTSFNLNYNYYLIVFYKKMLISISKQKL